MWGPGAGARREGSRPAQARGKRRIATIAASPAGESANGWKGMGDKGWCSPGRMLFDALAKAEYMLTDEWGRTAGIGTSSLGDRRAMLSLSVGESCSGSGATCVRG
jgi:hypothetical protein